MTLFVGAEEPPRAPPSGVGVSREVGRGASAGGSERGDDDHALGLALAPGRVGDALQAELARVRRELGGGGDVVEGVAELRDVPEEREPVGVAIARARGERGTPWNDTRRRPPTRARAPGAIARAPRGMARDAEARASANERDWDEPTEGQRLILAPAGARAATTTATTCAAALSSVRVVPSVTPAVAPSMAQALARVSFVASRARRGALVLRTRARDPPRGPPLGVPPLHPPRVMPPTRMIRTRPSLATTRGRARRIPALALAAPYSRRCPLRARRGPLRVPRAFRRREPDVVPPPDLDALLSDPGSGVGTRWRPAFAFRTDRVGEGNVERGILDTVDHYVPNPFGGRQSSPPTPRATGARSRPRARAAPYNFQAGVKDEVQDEPGGVSGMRVGSGGGSSSRRSSASSGGSSASRRGTTPC